MSDTIIEAEHLTRLFGARKAIDDVNLNVPRGTVFGFLGPNGAGKTTLIRMLLGLARPTAGSVRVRGFDIRKDLKRALERVGGIVEEPRFYPYMTGQQNLEMWAALLGRGAANRISVVLRQAGLHERGREKVSAYSLGMRQRLGLARALLNDPELLILDEPSNGLDAQGIVEFRAFVRQMAEEEGRTVFISSHLLGEMERMVDHVAVVNHGRVVIEGSMRQLIESGERGYLVDCDDPTLARRVLSGFTAVERVVRRDGALFVEVPPSREFAVALNRALVEAGAGVAGFRMSEQSLEQRYLEITGGEGPSDEPPSRAEP